MDLSTLYLIHLLAGRLMAAAAGSRTCKVLNVAEKNDAARELSNVMARGRVQRREGCSKYNKIYEFDFNILGMNAHMIMTSVSGHLLALDFLMAYRNWNSCTPETLFSADIHSYCPDNLIPVKKTLEREIRGCQHLILWTDGDREGENIADEIVHVITKVKSRGLSIHRARFSEITPQSVMNACRNLGVLNQRVSDAVNVRKELDLRIGSAFTRFQTKLLCKAFPSILGDQLVSYGPCQFPTLGFVVERYKEIQAFVCETFYKIKVTHEVGEEKVEFSWQRVRVFDHTVCLILYQLCLENPMAHVLGTTSRPRSKWRPLPLDTVELEKLASRKLRISAKETMRIAEKLYTQGFISYPRTETNIFPDSFDFSSIIQQQTSDPQWGHFASQLMTAGPTPRQGNKTDNAHPPIYPAKYTNTLSGNEKRIYELVARHFLACCSQDAKGQETKVEIQISEEIFTAQGLMILARNYLDVYPYDKWNAKTIPVYETGSSFQPNSIEMVDGETTPPPLLQEADLIGLMEKHGIGTDATHAEHIETIKTRNYVGVQDDGGFVPGELGMGLVEGYDSMGYELSKPQLRAELEADLKRICEGVRSKEDVLSEMILKYKEVFLNAKTQAHQLEQALSKYFGPSQPVTTDEAPPTLSETIRKCPECKQYNLVIKKKQDGGYMLSCLGYPECRTVQFFPKSVAEAKHDNTMCTECQPQPVHKILFRFKEGSVPLYVGPELVACSTCDPVLKEDLNFPPIKITTSSGSSARGAGASSSSSSGHRSRGGGSSASSVGRGARGGPLSRPMGRGTRGGISGRESRGGASSSSVGRGGASSSSSSSSLGRGRRGGASSSSFRGSESAGDSSNFNGRRTGSNSSFNGGRTSLTGTHSSFGGEISLTGGPSSFGVGTSLTGGPSSFGGGTSSFGGGTGAAGSNGSTQSFRGGRGWSRNEDLSSSSSSGYFSNTFYAPGAGDSTSNPITCNCGKQAILLTVRREDSSNKGRQFYKCPNQQDSDCNFFLWADQTPSATPSSHHMTSFSGSMNSIVNDHNQQNQIKRQPGCLSVQRSKRGGAHRGGRKGGSVSDRVMCVMCTCGDEAVMRTVQKEGPNKGRQFYVCSKSREEQCGFFEWADDLPAGSSVPSYSTRGRRGYGRGRGGRGNAGSTEGGGGGGRKRAPPTCSVCQEVGHTRRTCPNMIT